MLYFVLLCWCLFAADLRRSPLLIARELKKLTNLKQLNTRAYLESVNRKKVENKKKAACASASASAASASASVTSNPVYVAAEKLANNLAKKLERKFKKRAHKLQTQNNRLRAALKQERAEVSEVLCLCFVCLIINYYPKCNIFEYMYISVHVHTCMY